jgi:hypothetical protein
MRHRKHDDDDFALKKGRSGIIVHGVLVASFHAQLVTGWL